MFISRTTKKGTGIELYGKEADLRSLHEVIHYLAEGSTPNDKLSKGKNLLLMNFAYEVRKGYSGMRLIGSDKDIELIGLFGFSLVWTDILIFTNALRESSARMVTDESLLTHLDSLEMAVNVAIKLYDKRTCADILIYVGKRLFTEDEFIFQIYQSLHCEFISIPSGKARFRKIPALLDDYFSLFSPHRKSLIAKLTKLAIENKCDPADMEFEEFPEIIW